MPAAWDETRLLSGRPGDHVVLARRAGDRWFVGAGVSGAARTLDVPLTMLPGPVAGRGGTRRPGRAGTRKPPGRRAPWSPLRAGAGRGRLRGDRLPPATGDHDVRPLDLRPDYTSGVLGTTE
ncbi:glycoside hydrolase family 97 C-terminal domain-containing protein [Nonomuraea sp. B19D2]|uniref:glycoside hydrolase family 97 C-terminal domain-containing protein n=1 Tax=Nonomuraea sp. B19D2 TaxID=3159561 RepID=UPI0032DB6FE6